MKHRKAKRKSGFSIVEVMVSIAILAICLTGVLAALAYDAFSAEQGGAYSFAVGYSRRVLDLMQSGQIDPTVPGLADRWPPATPPFPLTSSNSANDGIIWRDLDEGLLNGGGAVNLWGAPGSVERQRFDIEKNKYGVNLASQRLVPTVAGATLENKYKNALVELAVTTRWLNKKHFRTVTLRGFYVTSYL